MLRYERRHTDPFIMVVVAMIIMFYQARVATLFLFPWSWSLDKVRAGPGALNEMAVFIGCGNLAMLAGPMMANQGPHASTRLAGSSQRLPHPAIIALLAVLSFLVTQLL